jgi:hypothetical protein
VPGEEGTSLWIYQPAYINPQSIVQYTINLGAKKLLPAGGAIVIVNRPSTSVTVAFYDPFLFTTSTSILLSVPGVESDILFSYRPETRKTVTSAWREKKAANDHD